MTITTQHACAECSSPYTRKRVTQDFCCNSCMKSFNNRRAIRGAQLYDLFMIMRFERKRAKVRGVWALACRLAMYWREEDLRDRNQNRSWKRLEHAEDQTSWARATIVHRG